MVLGMSYETVVALHDRSYFFSISVFVIIISIGIASQTGSVYDHSCPSQRADYDDVQSYDAAEEMCSMLNHVSNELWAAVAFSLSAMISSLWQVFSFSSYLRSPRMTQLPYSILLSALALIPFAKGSEYEFYSKNDNGVDPNETLNYKFVTLIFYMAAFLLYCQAGAQLCLPVASIGEPGSFRYNMVSLLPSIMPSIGIAVTSLGFVFMYIWWIALSECSFTPPLIMPESTDTDSDPCFFYGIQLSLFSGSIVISYLAFYCCRMLARARSNTQDEIKSISRESIFGNMPYFLTLLAVCVFGMALGIPYQYDLGEREDALIDERLHRNDLAAAACYVSSAQALVVGIWLLYRAAKKSGALKQIYIDKDKDEEEEEDDDDDDAAVGDGKGEIKGYAKVKDDIEKNPNATGMRVYRIGDSVDEPSSAALALSNNRTSATSSFFGGRSRNKKENQAEIDELNKSLLEVTRKTRKNWITSLFGVEDDDDDDGVLTADPRYPKQSPAPSERKDYMVDDSTYLLKNPSLKPPKADKPSSSSKPTRKKKSNKKPDETYDPPVIVPKKSDPRPASTKQSQPVRLSVKQESVSYIPPQPAVVQSAALAGSSDVSSSAKPVSLTAENLRTHSKLSLNRLSSSDDDDDDDDDNKKQQAPQKPVINDKASNASSGDEKGSLIGGLIDRISRRKNTPSVSSQTSNNEAGNWKKKLGIFSSEQPPASTQQATQAKANPPLSPTGTSTSATIGPGVAKFGVKKKNDESESLGSTNS